MKLMAILRLMALLVLFVNLLMAILFALVEAWPSACVSTVGVLAGVVCFYSAGKSIEAAQKAKE